MIACSDGIYAHSLPGRPLDEWESLGDHLVAVGVRAAQFAEPFGWAEAARFAGHLHDIGKLSAEFQAYIRSERTSGGDHSTGGAQAAAARLPHPIGRMLAFIVAGHHAGLANGIDLDARLKRDTMTAPGWQALTGPLPDRTAFLPTRQWVWPKPTDETIPRGFAQAFLIRMLFSCLVDADFLETERFYAEARSEPVDRGWHTELHVMRDRLHAHMAEKRANAPPTDLNVLRARVLEHALAQAALEPGLFTLTVPTGGGKTLASLSFALEHAVRHGLRRVVYVIPFTSIIEQTADVFRNALGPDRDTPNRMDILEHQSNFDWDAARADRSRPRNPDDEGPDGLEKLRRAAENWDVPIVVTTAVQFFESLFANRTSRCRKLHNLAKSVIVLDEAQTLPIHLLRPCMAALDELQRNYGTSAVLCTATQPALRKLDGFKKGFDIGDERELAPNPPRLYAALKRVTIEKRGSTGDETIAARLAEQAQMLCIVNSRKHARALFDRIRDLPGAAHLTTLMCPRHRRAVLAELRARLAAGEPVRLVATSLIEAGVDIDFPEVWRAAAGIDSIAQAAGRCNREFRLAAGRVVVFEPDETDGKATPPRELLAFWQAARPVLRKHDDPLTLEAVRDYFAELYWQKGEEALDGALVDAYRGVLPAIRTRAPDLAFPFESIAKAFRLIDDIMEPVVVPWRASANDDEADRILGRIAVMERPLARDLRRLQQYTVTIPKDVRDEWLARGVLRPVHLALGDTLLRFEDLAHYDPKTGVDITSSNLRLTEHNVIA